MGMGFRRSPDRKRFWGILYAVLCDFTVLFLLVFNAFWKLHHVRDNKTENVTGLGKVASENFLRK